MIKKQEVSTKSQIKVGYLTFKVTYPLVFKFICIGIFDNNLLFLNKFWLMQSHCDRCGRYHITRNTQNETKPTTIFSNEYLIKNFSTQNLSKFFGKSL